jgi:hypothetical protein
MQKIALSRRAIQVFTSFVATDTCLQEYRPIQNIWGYSLNIRVYQILLQYALYYPSECKGTGTVAVHNMKAYEAVDV